MGVSQLLVAWAAPQSLCLWHHALLVLDAPGLMEPI